MFESTADAVPRSGTSRRADFLPSAAAFEATIGGIGRTAGAEGERGATDRLLSLADLRVPGPAQVNPRAWEIRMIVEDRCRRLGIMLPNFAGYTTMSAYLFPTGAVELLVPVAVFNNLLYYIDEMYSTPGAHLSGAGDEHVVRRIRDGLDVFCRGATPPGDDPVFATCGWLRDTMLAVAPPGWFPRLAASLEHHLGAVFTPLQAVMVDGALDLDKYLTVREFDGGMYTVMDFIEFTGGFHLPDEVVQQPVIADLRACTVNIGGLMNDLFSYHKEVVVNGQRFNLVNVVMETRRCGFAEAVDHAVRLLNDITASFLDQAGRLPVYTDSALNAHVSAYVRGLYDQVLATYHWQMSTDRYRSTDSPFPQLRGCAPSTPTIGW